MHTAMKIQSFSEFLTISTLDVFIKSLIAEQFKGKFDLCENMFKLHLNGFT